MNIQIITNFLMNNLIAKQSGKEYNLRANYWIVHGDRA